MKPYKVRFFLAFFSALLLSGCAAGFDSVSAPLFETFPGQFLVGDVYILHDHQKIDGDIAGVGTTLIIEDGAMVLGDISLVGGNLEIEGRVAGDVNVLAGSAIIRDTAIITGDVNQALTAAEIEPKALVSGAINSYVFPAVNGAPSGEEVVSILSWLQPRRILLFKLFQVLGMTLVTLLMIYLFTDPTLKVVRAIRCNLPAAWGAGLLTYIAAPIISVVFIITICLSPVGLVVLITFLLSLLWGWVALASIIGEQLNRWLRLDWAVEPAAVLGAVVFGVSTALISFIPCLGFFINLVIASFGLGGVLLSRFGTCESK
jgi:hypothetical protein